MSRDMDQLKALRTYIVRHPELQSPYTHCLFARTDDAPPWPFFLDGEIFYALAEAKVLIDAWRRHYNSVRPHSSLG